MIEKKFIGRAEEQVILKEALQSNEPEMIAVTGRRRVGKTFLIKETYKEHLLFEITGLQDSTLEKQLQHFSFTLNQYAKSPIPLQQPKNWLEAFQMLVLYLQNEVETAQKKVVFFDELPWLAA
ncbi:MAG: AAA family ATPase, partial [Saprospiraceae bacterium]|nr:AAA family ATPase [Saprospiraceae bacterium]